MADGGYPGRTTLARLRQQQTAPAETNGYSGRAILARLHGQQPSTTPASPRKKSHGGLLHSIEKYSGAELASNLAKDIGSAAVGVAPGLYGAGKTAVVDPWVALAKGHNSLDPHSKEQHAIGHLGGQVEQQYKDYYGHDVAHHLYTHPLQPILDALTVADLGASGVAKIGQVAAEHGAIPAESGLAKLGDRGTVTTRSPKKIATGHGPENVDLTSTKPIVKAREQAVAAARSHPKLVERKGGELQQYGKQIQADANQHALSRLTQFEPYHKATRKLSPDEWTALHIRALDIHPEDLAQVWKGTRAEGELTPKVRELALHPSKRMIAAEPQTRALSRVGERLYKEQNKLKSSTATARADMTKRQASEMLGRPVRQITGDPYYFPHTFDDGKIVSPLQNAGGGKGVPRKLGSMKQSTGSLALSGKLHLRGDVLGPEFLRRVKFVKYDEIHNALVRGAVPVTSKQIEAQFGGHLPKGWEYVRQNAATRIPPSIRGEGSTTVPIDKLIPNPEDLHNSTLAKDGFSTTDLGQAHSKGGVYYIVPKNTVRAATGEFTRSGDFVHAWISRPLKVWRAAVLGLRVGFLTNNLVGNSVMYAARTGGQGGLRDLFAALYETHGPQVAKKALDSAATPPGLKADLYKEFFPEQIQGTFGRTQTPANSTLHLAGKKAVEAGRTATGAIPKLTSKVAEEVPRRALIRHFIRHSPEFKQVYRGLPKQTRSFEEAARKVFSGDGGAAYQRYISKQVNQALGDYLHLSPVERNVLRNALPFYAWYRAIATTTYHLAVDTPLRANILGQLGQIGRQYSDNALGDIPTFLEGAIPLGNGRNNTQRVLATQGLNPYATLEQLHRGATSDVTDLGLNPFLVGAAQAFQQAKNGKIAPAQLAGTTLRDMVKNLPPSRLISPTPPSALYPNRNRKSELLSFLGAPVKEYNRGIAKYQKGQGR